MDLWLHRIYFKDHIFQPMAFIQTRETFCEFLSSEKAKNWFVDWDLVISRGSLGSKMLQE